VPDSILKLPCHALTCLERIAKHEPLRKGSLCAPVVAQQPLRTQSARKSRACLSTSCAQDVSEACHTSGAQDALHIHKQVVRPASFAQQSTLIYAYVYVYLFACEHVSPKVSHALFSHFLQVLSRILLSKADGSISGSSLAVGSPLILEDLKAVPKKTRDKCQAPTSLKPHCTN
jgi:hypothetical protein